MTSQRDEALPPLPKAYYTIAWAEENGMYSAGQMRDYARAALAAAPAAQPQSDLNVKTMYCLECERLSRELAELRAQTAAQGEPVAEVTWFDPLGLHGRVKWLWHSGDALVLGQKLYAAPHQPAAQWRSVDDELPPLNTEVLVAFDTRPLPATAQLCMHKGMRQWMWPSENDPTEGEEPVSVTHWMPLPDHPHEERFGGIGAQEG